MNERAEFTIRFADGTPLALGRRTLVMGVLNVTPDSFSDGGRYLDPAAALAAARTMVEGGADILDIGGESTRPGAGPTTAAEQIERVVPIVTAIKRTLPVRISIDTMKASVARRALDAGADLVNDVSGLRDPDMLPLLCERQAPVVIVHMRGTPQTMQRRTDYDDLMQSLVGFLRDRAQTAVAAGLADDKIVVDPGLGFGKSAAGNLTVLRQLAELAAVGRPLLIGASRKSFIGTVLDAAVDERLEGSLAIAAHASAEGAHVIRAHDVSATVRVVRMIDAIRSAGPPAEAS